MNAFAEVREEYEYITVYQLPIPKGRKTPVYNVIRNESHVVIGTLQWYGAWRQFCFYPCHATIWSRDCLEDIRFALAWAEERRREARGERVVPPPPLPPPTNVGKEGDTVLRPSESR